MEGLVQITKKEMQIFFNVEIKISKHGLKNWLKNKIQFDMAINKLKLDLHYPLNNIKILLNVNTRFSAILLTPKLKQL